MLANYYDVYWEDFKGISSNSVYYAYHEVKKFNDCIHSM